MPTTAKTILDPLNLIEISSGVAAWRLLSWDTEQFGFPAASLERMEASGSYDESRRAKRELLERTIEACRIAGVRHLTARAGVDETSAIHALEAAGFELIDAIQTFEVCVMGAQFVTGVRLFRRADLPAVVEIGRSAFHYDRFHADSSLPPGAADRIYATWTRNCCLGAASDAVLVAEDEKRVAGFVACRQNTDHGVIVLVATAGWARGRGIAKRITLSSLAWFEQQRIRRVEVGTQLKNIPAGRLYESCGFRLARAGFTFRRTL